ncbi:MAG: FAD-dependent oxidoreductase [Patescibacteria group bacterium]|nr:FAD-dependent oxidoreductase [Patescibacteria group bacterium]
MRIAILGAGFTGLTAAMRLLQNGDQISIFEKENEAGGLASGFQNPGWEWSLEKSYHHWFTNDASVLNLAKELNHPTITVRPKTEVLVNQQILPLDSAAALLTFPYFPIADRLRTGLATLYLKLINNHQHLKGQKALPWIKKYMGERSFRLIWEPLFIGKFGDFREKIALTWFWARIKKRTSSLVYPQGGFKPFIQRLADKVQSLGGEIVLGTEVTGIRQEARGISLKIQNARQVFDKVIVTLPSPIFAKITPQLPSDYIQKISSIPHLHALNLILVLKKPFLKNTYWLNITDKSFPFLVLAEHTNFMDPKHYNNQHTLYIGNYLPSDHPYLKMTAEQLLKIFDPFLKQINPSYSSSLISYHLFQSPFAQPIVTNDYPNLIPQMQTPLKNVYLANLDMVYPWDRGTNYAVEMGEKAAELINRE